MAKNKKAKLSNWNMHNPLLSSAASIKTHTGCLRIAAWLENGWRLPKTFQTDRDLTRHLPLNHLRREHKTSDTWFDNLFHSKNDWNIEVCIHQLYQYHNNFIPFFNYILTVFNYNNKFTDCNIYST